MVIIFCVFFGFVDLLRFVCVCLLFCCNLVFTCCEFVLLWRVWFVVIVLAYTSWWFGVFYCCCLPGWVWLSVDVLDLLVFDFGFSRVWFDCVVLFADCICGVDGCFGIV